MLQLDKQHCSFITSSKMSMAVTHSLFHSSYGKHHLSKHHISESHSWPPDSVSSKGVSHQYLATPLPFSLVFGRKVVFESSCTVEHAANPWRIDRWRACDITKMRFVRESCSNLNLVVWEVKAAVIGESQLKVKFVVLRCNHEGVPEGVRTSKMAASK